MLITVYDLHDLFTMVLQMLCLNLELLDHSQNSHLRASLLAFQIDHSFELCYVLVTDSLVETRFIEDHHGVEILLATRQLLTESVEVEIETPAMDTLSDTDERLQLADDHGWLILAADTDDVLDLLLVGHAAIEHFVR